VAGDGRLDAPTAVCMGAPGGLGATQTHNEMRRYRHWETPYALTQALTATSRELLLPQAAHSCGPGGTPAYLATLCCAVLYGRGPLPHSLAAAPVYLSAGPTAAWTTLQAAQPLQHKHGLPARADCATCLQPDRHLPPSPHMRHTPSVWCTPTPVRLWCCPSQRLLRQLLGWAPAYEAAACSGPALSTCSPLVLHQGRLAAAPGGRGRGPLHTPGVLSQGEVPVCCSAATAAYDRLPPAALPV
jgi:hypothetical protein